MAGNLGAIFLCLSLIVAPYLYTAGTLALARWRWAQRGSSSYTVVITQLCNCAAGQYRLTVRGGRVIAVETVGARGRLTTRGPNPAGFNDLTVEAAFERVGRSLRANWLPSRSRPIAVEFDPVLGYVTRFESGQANAPMFYYVYAARDLRLDSP